MWIANEIKESNVNNAIAETTEEIKALIEQMRILTEAPQFVEGVRSITTSLGTLGEEFVADKAEIKKIDESIKNKTTVREAIEAGTNCTKRNS